MKLNWITVSIKNYYTVLEKKKYVTKCVANQEFFDRYVLGQSLSYPYHDAFSTYSLSEPASISNCQFLSEHQSR